MQPLAEDDEQPLAHTAMRQQRLHGGPAHDLAASTKAPPRTDDLDEQCPEQARVGESVGNLGASHVELRGELLKGQVGVPAPPGGHAYVHPSGEDGQEPHLLAAASQQGGSPADGLRGHGDCP